MKKEEFIENGFDRAHIITINFEDLQFEKIRTAVLGVKS